jgi:hypothetical protein
MVPVTEPMVPVIEDNIWYRLQVTWYLLYRTISGTGYKSHGTCYRGQYLVPVTAHMAPAYRGQYLVPLTEPMVPVIEDNIWYRLQIPWYLL